MSFKGINKCTICAKFEKNVHYNCSGLPPYFIMQLEMSKMEYYCFQCVTKKKKNVEQIKAIKQEISNQKDDLKDTEADSTDKETDSQNDLERRKIEGKYHIFKSTFLSSKH